MMARLTISLLGSFQVTLDGEPVTDFATDKTRALLAHLSVEADRPHHRDALVGLLWPDQLQRKARQNLRQALSHLRQAIGDQDGEDSGVVPFLLVSRQTIQFNSNSDHWLDVAAFKALIETCRRHRHRRRETCLPCMRRMEHMVELYQGDFLEHFFLSDSDVFEEWALLKREWLRREMVEALPHLAHYYERRGEYERARQYAWRQVELEPWHEEAHRHLMRLLALDGQRGAALAQYEACRRTLAEELGVEPTAETTALYEQIRTRDQGSVGVREYGSSLPHPHVSTLPLSPTSFVGRGEELAELAELLANPDCRLVTLVGPGGIGKTRLALQVAADQIGAFIHGVHFVPLTSFISAELIIPTIAEALDFPFSDSQNPKEQLLNYLREKEMLLVLDSLEHILEGMGWLAEILWCAPGVMLLATSRERLNLREEWVYAVEGLEYPENGSLDRLGTCSAVNLFQQRACQVYRHFLPSEVEIPHMVRICQLVEGMPLGVELAAASVAVRSCEEIATEIERNLGILTTRLRNVPARQRSVQATFEHSWQLLSETERELFARLSVFRGGFRQEAATVVAKASLPTLMVLLEKSLIRRVSSDRYDMHSLLRQYAAEKLRDDPQAHEETLIEQSRYFAAFLEQREQLIRGAEPKQALAEIALEIENARQAWRLAVTRGDVSLVEQSLESLYRFYNLQCRFQEGIDLLAQATDRWSKDPRQASIFGQALSRQGVLHLRQGLCPQARTALEQSLTIFERLGMQSEQAFCLVNLANVSCNQGQYEEAGQLAQEGLTLFRQAEDQWGMGRSLYQLGLARYRTGDVDQAEELFEESLAIGRESGDQHLTMSPLNGLGDIACHRGDYAKAQVVFGECLVLSRELDRYNVAIHLNNLGTVLHTLGRYEEAWPHYQESLEICREIGDRKGEAIALSNLGEVAYALDVRREALAYYQEALAIGRSIEDQQTIMVCLNNLGEIACVLEDHAGAKAYFAEVLMIASKTQTLLILLKSLVNLAVLLVKQGQVDRAAELLDLARRHPACEQMDQDKAGRLLDEMGFIQPDSAPRPLDTVVVEILAEISPDASAYLPLE
ncbi:MAG: tetratricopeptide repeat protein [Chloroflexota bacterium]|nr:tetratricopeptide repeat protein [Chloroflexota bacterium]